ncbi:MAG TPA: hypothetical protein VGM22_06260 [Methylomirabilota bacterium]|jgi:hypothetical protein
MSDLVEDPAGYNLRWRYKWRFLAGMAATMIVNAGAAMYVSRRLAHALGVNPDVPRNNAFEIMVSVGCMLSPVLWGIVALIAYHVILAVVLRARGSLPRDAGATTLLSWTRFPSHWLLSEPERRSAGVWSMPGFQRLGFARQWILVALYSALIFSLIPALSAIQEALETFWGSERQVPIWRHWNDLIPFGVLIVVIAASSLLVLWVAVAILAGVSLALRHLTPKEAWGLIRYGRYPKSWARADYRVGDTPPTKDL